jgi:TatD DNase family protein
MNELIPTPINMPDRVSALIIHNLSPAEALNDHSGRVISAGLHPWHAGADWEQQLGLLARIAGEERVAMIGEAGLDRMCATAFALQQKVFVKQAELAESVGKPLIIHCVKAWGEIMAARKLIRPDVAWIIHGFRGKPQLARQLLDGGFYLSFGEKFNEASLLATPLERLCTETDESMAPIEEIYRRVAAIKGVDAATLAATTNRPVRQLSGGFIDIHKH